jgi:hypothetical protein
MWGVTTARLDLPEGQGTGRTAIQSEETHRTTILRRCRMYSDRQLADVRNRLADILGCRDYNRMIGWVGDVREGRRFRYWQEQLLRKASAAGIPLDTTEEFLEVFRGATPVPVPMEPWTRERFLKAIEEFPLGGIPFDETPPEWMTTAWETERIRSEISSSLARDVSKCGNLCRDHEYFDFMSQALPVARQVELFVYIRDMSPTRECEFRGQFERAFPACVSQLPPARSIAELAAMIGMTEEEYRRRSQPPERDPNDPPAHIDDEIPF